MLGILNSSPFWLPYVVLIIFRIILSKTIGSPGLYFLSIDNKSMAVDEQIHSQETWCTILAGAVLTLKGTKNLVGWLDYEVANISIPIFGFFPSDNIQIAMYLTTGFLLILSGYWFFKLDMKGYFLVIALSSLVFISNLLSWNLWEPVAAEIVMKRRTAQGLSLRAGEIEFMQTFMPWALVIGSAVIILTLLISYKKFKKQFSS